jgi:type IV fimbrial biogenesis protein FimT
MAFCTHKHYVLGMKLSIDNSGFTLMELLVVLFIISLLSLFVTPSMSGFVDNNRLHAGAGDLISAMQSARAEAVGRNAAATLCKRNADATGCLTTGGWQQGWIVFVDADRDAAVDVGEEILLVHDALSAGLTFYGTDQVEDAITFRAGGQTGITSTQTLILCDYRGFGLQAKGMIVSILGRASAMPAPNTGQTTCLVPGT